MYDMLASEVDKSKNLEYIHNFYKFKEARNNYITLGSEVISSEYLDKKVVRTYNRTGLLNFIMRSMFSNMHTLKWYDGADLEVSEYESPDKIKDVRATSFIKGWTNDYSTKSVGAPRLRQLRVSDEWSGAVPSLFKPWYGYRVGHLNILNEEKKPFRSGWNSFPRFYKEPPVWTYESYRASESVGMFGYSGLFYRSGGYGEMLHTTKGNSDRKLIRLFMNDWIDNYTRAIFVEANLYSVNSNLFSVITIITEYLPSGVYLTKANVEAAYLTFSSHDYYNVMVIILTISLILIILIIIGIKSVILKSLLGIRNFSTNWWTLCDALLIIIGTLMFVGYLLTLIYFNLFKELLQKDKSARFTSFYEPFYWLNETYILGGVFAILFAIRLINYHSPVLLTLDIRPFPTIPKPSLICGQVDWEQFQSKLEEKLNLRISLKTAEELDNAVEHLTTSIQTSVWESSTHSVAQRTHMTNIPLYIRTLITDKRRARAKWQRTRYPSDKREFNRLTHLLRNQLRQLKEERFEEYTSSPTK
uniref:PKD_channel domain-containing protein n=1 Tax=Rhodnius prolixus TaxID=13249 RepID=T1HG07_RHOPR